MMNHKKVTDAHNHCAEFLNAADLSNAELIATLAQLLIYTGKGLTKKDIDIYDMNISQLNKEYYANNTENDIGLGLILNGASIMGTLPESITGNEIAQQENQHDDQVSTTT